jgi:hypothetical protein
LARYWPRGRRIAVTVTVSRKELRDRLAQSSHDTYERHYLADPAKDPAKMTRELHDHDYDRADAAIAVLEELGVWRDSPA